MRRIAVINQKGGVGKTTTTVNLGAALAHAGYRTQIIDLDPQAHASLHLGVEPGRSGPSIYDALVGNVSLAEIRREVEPNLHIIGSHIDLAAAEVELSGVVGREVILRDQLDAEQPPGQEAVEPHHFDFTLMDCPPSLGVLTLNALTAAYEVLIPLQPHFLALHGMSKLLETTALVRRRINPRLRVTGIVLCLVEVGVRLTTEIIEDLTQYIESGRRRDVPWSEARIFTTRVRRNIRLAECPSFGQSIFSYAADSNGAQDYQLLAAELAETGSKCVLRPLAATA